MIKAITVTNHLAESIKLELAFPEKSGFAIRSIEGLGPVKADINTTELSTTDGSLYTSARTTSRNIVLDLLFLFKPTIEASRYLSYKFFPLKKRIKLFVETDTRTCYIYGYVESNEPNIFSKEEGSRISIICPDPYFYSNTLLTSVFSGIEPAFEFPFSNESLTDPLLETGIIKTYHFGGIYYNGEGRTGVIITIHATGGASNIRINNTKTKETMYINTDLILEITGVAFGDLDDIIINTNKSVKSILLLRNGEYVNILNCLDRQSDWFTLENGENIFAYSADTGVDNLLFKIEYRPVYEGV